MKIGPSTAPSAAPAVSDPALRTASPAGTAAGLAPVAPVARTRATDQVDLSAAGARIGTMDGASDFDSAKVDAIRQAIRDGKFSVNAGAIADRLIADATSLLGPRTPSA
ncbi:MAG: flagellar biosynthesis anti-sigma factor FlgM [Ramlibacter sp.]